MVAKITIDSPSVMLEKKKNTPLLLAGVLQ
jgi:hypothetical protein